MVTHDEVQKYMNPFVTSYFCFISQFRNQYIDVVFVIGSYDTAKVILKVFQDPIYLICLISFLFVLMVTALTKLWVQILRKKYPQFAQQHNGGYMQQVLYFLNISYSHVLFDFLWLMNALKKFSMLYTLFLQDAEECWTQLMYTLSQSLRSTDSDSRYFLFIISRLLRLNKMVFDTLLYSFLFVLRDSIWLFCLILAYATFFMFELCML